MQLFAKLGAGAGTPATSSDQDNTLQFRRFQHLKGTILGASETFQKQAFVSLGRDKLRRHYIKNPVVLVYFP